jgi:Ca2+-binding EF-hand superfamily protein
MEGREPADEDEDEDDDEEREVLRAFNLFTGGTDPGEETMITLQDLERIAREIKLDVRTDDLAAMIEVANGEGEVRDGVSLKAFAGVMRRCGAI